MGEGGRDAVGLSLRYTASSVVSLSRADAAGGARIGVQTATNPHDLTRTTLAVLFILDLIAVSFPVVRPFLSATVWATTLV